MSIPHSLAAVAATQRGIITRPLAHQHGCSDNDIRRWLVDGTARALWRGIMTVNAEPATPTERHAELAHAVSAGYGGDLIVSHQSALVLAGLPTYDVDLGTVRCLRRSGGASLRTDRIKISRCQLTLPTYELRGARVVHEAVAIAQVARESGVDAAVVAADAALNRRSVTTELLERAVQLLERLGPSPRAREMLRLMDGRAESPGETILRLIAVRANLEVDPQFIVLDRAGAFVARTDLRIKGSRVIAEFDGETKYSRGASVFNEKKREDAIRGLLWRVERFVWADLDYADQVVYRLLTPPERRTA